MYAIECRRIACARSEWNNSGPMALNAVDLQIRKGKIVGVAGPDGCGKGLLLNVIGLLEQRDAGDLVIEGNHVPHAGIGELAEWRDRTFGFLFGHPYLLPSFSVGENVAVPLFRICGGNAYEARCRTLEALEMVGLSGRESVLAGKLGREERWLAALARAVVHKPKCLVAISPPAECGLESLVRQIRDQLEITVIWSGDVPFVERFADRIVTMSAGRVIGECILREAA